MSPRRLLTHSLACSAINATTISSSCTLLLTQVWYLGFDYIQVPIFLQLGCSLFTMQIGILCSPCSCIKLQTLQSHVTWSAFEVSSYLQQMSLSLSGMPAVSYLGLIVAVLDKQVHRADKCVQDGEILVFSSFVVFVMLCDWRSKQLLAAHQTPLTFFGGIQVWQVCDQESLSLNS